jgi:hypothetical protein
METSKEFKISIMIEKFLFIYFFKEDMKREDSIEALPDAISSGEFVNYN